LRFVITRRAPMPRRAIEPISRQRVPVADCASKEDLTTTLSLRADCGMRSAGALGH
jgi:hypothetical protein